MVALLLVGLGLTLAVDRGGLLLPLPGDEGAGVPGTWLFAAVLVALAGLGAEWVVRTHPLSASGIPSRWHIHWRRFDLDLGTRARLWMLPALLTVGAVLFLTLFDDAWVLSAILAGAGLTLGGAFYGLYHTIDLLDARFGLANTLLNLLIHLAAFLLYGAIYAQGARSLLSAPAMGLVTAALLYEILARASRPATPPVPLRRLLLYALLGGGVLAQVTWGLNYWAVTALTAGSFLLVMFYVSFGLLSAALTGQLRGPVIREFGAVTLVALETIAGLVMLQLAAPVVLVAAGVTVFLLWPRRPS